MLKRNHPSSSQSGSSLLELLVVALVIGLIAAAILSKVMAPLSARQQPGTSPGAPNSEAALRSWEPLVNQETVDSEPRQAKQGPVDPDMMWTDGEPVIIFERSPE